MTNSKFNSFLAKVKNLIFPRNIKCVFCGEELNQNAINNTCEQCLKTLPFITDACPRCGNPIYNGLEGVCIDCSNSNFNFVFAKSVFKYSGKVRNVIQNLKFDAKFYLVPTITKYLVDEFAKMNIFPDYVTNVPMHSEHFKARGFNQTIKICEEFSKLTNIPFVEFCEKTKNTPSQIDLSYAERKTNLKGAFAVKPEFKKQVKNKVILLIDDVFTTGATSNEICTILDKAGATACYVLTFAHSVLDKNFN